MTALKMSSVLTFSEIHHLPAAYKEYLIPIFKCCLIVLPVNFWTFWCRRMQSYGALNFVQFFSGPLCRTQLSQRDRAAGWVSFGQKWKTILLTIFNHCDVICVRSGTAPLSTSTFHIHSIHFPSIHFPSNSISTQFNPLSHTHHSHTSIIFHKIVLILLFPLILFR